jgi:ankyrin repeat protein
MTAHKSDTVRAALVNQEKASLKAEDENGHQVMHYWACASTDGEEVVEIGKCLLDAGAHVNAHRQDGNTPLHCVVAAHNEGQDKLAFYKARFLVCNGADIHLRNWAGETARNLLVCDGRASTARMLQLLTHGVARNMLLL